MTANVISKLESLREQSIRAETQKGILEQERAEILEWFSDQGFDIDGDLEEQINALTEEIESEAQALLEKYGE